MRNAVYPVIRSVQKALRILRAFDNQRPEFGLTELSNHCGFPKSVTHKLVRTLADAGFLEQDQATRRYRIGPVILTVAGTYLGTNPLIREGTAVLHRLAGTTGHTATLGVLDRSEVLYIAAVEGTQAVKASARVGDRRPLHATATGKVLLSGLSETEVDRLLGPGPLPALTRATITNPAVLKQELHAVGKAGVAYNLRERSEEASAIAAPVYDHTRRIAAAVSVAFPATVQDQRVLDELTAGMKAHAQELSRRLGAPDQGDGQVVTAGSWSH